jgi:hypothetical protein
MAFFLLNSVTDCAETYGLYSQGNHVIDHVISLLE